MTTQTLEATSRLEDFDYEARIERVRAYVEQLERADQEADKGWMPRAADLTDLYEDPHWVEEMRVLKPIPLQRRPGQNKQTENSRQRFYFWAEHRLTSPTTGRPARRTVTKELLDLDQVVRAAGGGGLRLEEGLGRGAVRPLISFVKHERHDEVPKVLRRAQRLAEDKGQQAHQGIVREAIAEHNKTLGSKPPTSPLTLDALEHRIERDWDSLVRHSDPERCKALHRRLADRFKQEQRYARGEAWTA
jgi:hypothetical protein